MAPAPSAMPPRLLIPIAAVFLALCARLDLAGAQQTVQQPAQPASGPGGKDYPHAHYRVTSGGQGDDAWYVFEPVDPQPVSAPLAIILHGYFEYSGYSQMQLLIEHTVRKGNVVIYPRWQTSLVQPCAGPADIEPCMKSAINGIRGALGYLQSDMTRVQPQLDKASYFGFSFGGIITANLANRWQGLGMPEPKVVFLDDPDDGGYAGNNEPTLDPYLSGIPATTLFECHSGASGVFKETYVGTGGPATAEGQPRPDASCNTVFPRLTSIPARNKSLVMTSDDNHGSPALSSGHGVCARSTADAYAWGFCWKVWDALRSCASSGTDCQYALGDTPEHRYIGTWSDGVPVIGLKVQDEAPIRATPVPARKPAPAATTSRAGSFDCSALLVLAAIAGWRRRRTKAGFDQDLPNDHGTDSRL